jgi:hypothetical protein
MDLAQVQHIYNQSYYSPPELAVSPLDVTVSSNSAFVSINITSIGDGPLNWIATTDD